VQILVGLLLAVLCAGGSIVDQAWADVPGQDPDKVQTGTLTQNAEQASQAGTLYALALSRDASGDHAGAIDMLRQVVLLDGSYTDGQVKLASLLLASHQPDAAYEQLVTAQAAHADPTAIKALLAQVEVARGHQDQARKLAGEALAQDPSSTDAMRALLDLGEAQHDLESAVGRVTERLAAAHAPVGSYLALVKIYLDLTGQENPPPDGVVVLKTLLGIYQMAEKIAPTNVDLLSVLSDTYNQLGQNDAALAALLQAQKVEPQDLDLMMRCAASAADAGNKDEEMAQYQKAYALDPQRVRSSLATTYFENQQYDKALEMMKKMLADAPNDPMLLIRLGVTCEALNRKDEAHGWFVKATRSPALTLDAALKLAAYFIDSQRGPEAVPVVAAGLRRFPTSPDLHFYAAVQAMEAHQTKTAFEEYEQAAKSAGGDPSSMGVNFYVAGANILAAAGRHEEIDALLQQGLQRYPDDPNILNQQAWEWAGQGRQLDRALAAAQKADSLAPDNGQMQDTLGYVYLKMNKPAAALPVLQQAAKMTNNDPSVLQHLGDAYLARGQTTEALAAWRRALQKDPANPDLNQRIQLNERSAQHAFSSPASP
jgi:tetratricopeptide (TPR) repeat protein